MPRFGRHLQLAQRGEGRDLTCALPSAAISPGTSPERRLDDGIVAARWLTPEEIRPADHRSPLILRCMMRISLAAGCRYPLELLTHYG